MSQHRFLQVAFGLSIAAVACTSSLSEQNHPCPCSSGWTCCENVCLAPGSSCAPGDSGTTGTSSDAASASDATDADAASIDASNTDSAPAEASPSADGAPGDLCNAAPLTIAPGQTLHATTCGGVAGINEPCVGGPVVPIAVDAPDGAIVEFTVSPGARFLVFPTCQSNGPVECSGVTNPTFESMPGYILAVNRYDTDCGDFTLSASLASDAGAAPDAH
ncbi:MAG: hypothetical protein ACRENE_05335 [Polyangiaceae bacterium]